MIGRAVSLTGTHLAVLLTAVTASTGTTVALLVIVLVVLGLAMIVLAVWLVRTTRTDPRALGPLEVMGDRRWRRGDADRRRTNLDTARPSGAPPPAPMVPLEVDEGEPVVLSEGDQAAEEQPSVEVTQPETVPEPEPKSEPEQAWVPEQESVPEPSSESPAQPPAESATEDSLQSPEVSSSPDAGSMEKDATPTTPGLERDRAE